MTMEGVDIDQEGLKVLDRDECLRLLATASVGRVAVSVRALPVIVPVHFVVDDDRILIRTHAGSTLDAATSDTVVAFETGPQAGLDSPDWSVHVTGVARHISAEEQPAHPGAVGPVRSTSDRSDRVIAISTDRISGRRSYLAGRGAQR
jgi:hypothetical protein